MTIPILVTRRPQGQRIGLAIATVVSIALLWILPPVGFVACAVMLVIAPPWGRSITERGLISLLLALGVIAIAFPRASSVPVTPFSQDVVDHLCRRCRALCDCRRVRCTLSDNRTI